MIFPKSRHISGKNMYRMFATLMCLVIFAFLFTESPVVLIVLISAVEAPVLSISALALVYLIHKKLPQSMRPGLLWHTVIVLGTLVYLVLSSAVLIKTIFGSN